MKRTMVLSATLLQLVFCAYSAYAWSRLPQVDDGPLVERSKLIVVAHLKDGSIEESKGSTDAIPEFTARLVITEVLKGKCAAKEIKIIIHGGLYPSGKDLMDKDQYRDNYIAKGIIRIWDFANSPGFVRPSYVEDARDDNLWFLRKPHKCNYEIDDPDELQPLKWKAYYLLYLSTDPEAGVRAYIKEHPEAANRGEDCLFRFWEQREGKSIEVYRGPRGGQRFLDHLEVQRILKIKDPEKRYDRLLPFYLKIPYKMPWISQNQNFLGWRDEVTEGIINCGALAGDKLKTVFHNPQYSNYRGDIIDIWNELAYREAVPALIDMLNEHDKLWSEQKTLKVWNDGYSAKGKDRNELSEQIEQFNQLLHIIDEDYNALCLLRKFHAVQARDALEMRRKRYWALNQMQIVGECEAALRELEQKKTTH